MQGIRDERRAKADEEVAAEGVRVADAVRHREKVAIIFSGESRGDEGPRLGPRLNNKDRIGDPDHESVALREEVDPRGRIRRIFREKTAAFLNDLSRKAAITPWIEHLVGDARAR